MMRQVGLRLRNARLEARLSQAALGAMIGVTNIQIGCYEKGVTPLTLPRAVLLAGALDVDVRGVDAVRRGGAGSGPQTG